MFGLNVNINTCNFNLIPKLEPCFVEQTLGLRWLLRLGWPTTVEVMLCSCWEILPFIWKESTGATAGWVTPSSLLSPPEQLFLETPQKNSGLPGFLIWATLESHPWSWSMILNQPHIWGETLWVWDCAQATAPKIKKYQPSLGFWIPDSAEIISWKCSMRLHLS